jgi:tetratricopeptide (TPR) repeat protein
LRHCLVSLFALVFFLLSNAVGASAQTAKKSSADSVKRARARLDSVNKAKKNEAEARIEARKHALDSIRLVREHKLDSAQKAREYKTDSLAAARKYKADSIAKVRKHRSDSIASIRRHKESRKYRDSVARAKKSKEKAVIAKRQAKMDSIRDARQHYTDSVAAVRKERTDSLTTVRKERTDSIAAVRKARTDSLARIKKYKSSKRYTDSVTLVRRHRSDSIKAHQLAFRDSIAAIRKHNLDSAKTARQHILDSTKLVRTKKLDSLKMVRKAKADSLLKKKADKEKLAKAKEKKKLEDLKLKIDLKQKKEREAWSNKTMLKKGWGPKRRLTQNSFTHYNYYYNARRKMEEAEMNMRRVNKENYDSLIGLFPFDPNKDSSLLAADMDSIVHKVSVGIQIHDPRIKWGNDMYLLLGEAYYYKGSYENAATSFRYIIANDQNAKKKKKGKSGYYTKSKEAPSIVEKKKKSKLGFLKHKSVHNDAILWLARTYTTSNQAENAGSVLSLLEYDENLPDDLVGKLAVEKAFAFLRERNYPEASKQLAIANEDDGLPNWLRMRIAFLNGQLLMNNGDFTAAAESFDKVLGFYPKIEMDFYARKYIAQCRLRSGQDVAAATGPLKKLLHDGKYANEYDQIYYELGKLSAKSGDNPGAVNYFTKSTSTPKGSRKQKALSFAALGDVHYSTGAYADAKSAYDSAAKYAGSNNKDKAVAAAVQRSTGLKEVSGPLGVIQEQDSLLALASMSKKEQQSAIKRYLRDLQKQRDDSIFRAESGSTAVASAAEADMGGPGGPGSGGTSWYFSNPSLVSQGAADFKRKWGNRPLTDNWRRAAAQPAGGARLAGAPSAGGDEEEEEEVETTEDGLPTEEALASKIPNTKQQKEAAYKIEQKAYILLAKAYVDQLQDYSEALNALDTLDKRFPAHSQKEEELYLRYRIAVKQNKLDKAQAYANELLTKYPRSQYAGLLKPRQSEAKSSESTSEVAAYFDQTYSQLMKHQYTEVLMRVEEAQKKYEDPLYHRRFELVEAMAYAGSGNYNMADSLTNKFIKTNPSDTLVEWAKAVAKYAKDMREGGQPSWYKDLPPVVAKADVKKPEEKKPASMEPSTPPPPSAPEPPKAFSYQVDSQHYGLIVLPGLDSRTGGLKKTIVGFNAEKFAPMGLEVVIDMFDMSQSVMIVRNFSNAATAKAYMDELLKVSLFSGYLPGEVKTYIISSRNYMKMFADKTTGNYPSFYSANYAQ